MGGKKVEQTDEAKLLALIKKGRDPFSPIGASLPPSNSDPTDIPDFIDSDIETVTADIEHNKHKLEKYRTIQSLQLVKLQEMVIANITPQKIAEAPLRDLVTTIRVLKQTENLMEGKATSITGLLGYLVELEKQDALDDGQIKMADAIESEFKSEEVFSEMPKL
jgi:hypothetical protein